MVLDVISCPLCNLKNVWYIIPNCIVSDAISCLLYKLNTLWFIDTSQLCRTGHEDVLHTGMTTLACLLSELFPLDCLSCNALYFEYRQDYFHETIRFCRKVVTVCHVDKIWWLSCSYLP